METTDDKDATVLPVKVDNDAIPLPVKVDNDATELLTVDSPEEVNVDNEATALFVPAMSVVTAPIWSMQSCALYGLGGRVLGLML